MIAALLALLISMPAVVVAETGAEPTAMVMPKQVTICIDRAAQRCWTSAGASDCPGGERVATLAADSADVGPALRRCWSDLRPDP